MSIGLIGKKIGMTHVYSDQGNMIPVTVIAVGPCPVVQKKTDKKEGYSALQIGFREKKPDKLTKPLRGQFKNLEGKAYTVLKELRFADTKKYNVGDEITVDIFDSGEKVAVTGVSKGKGFAGGIKRWGFSRGPMTHGSKFHRAQGSTGMSATPSRVVKGRKMPGQMGSKKVTVKNLIIVEKREQENLLLIKGAIPGGKNGIVTICKQ